MNDPQPDRAKPADTSLAIGPQEPGGFEYEARLILEIVRDLVPSAPKDLVAVYNREDGTAILQGTPADAQVHARILEAARGVAGVTRVDDRMHFGPRRNP